MRKKEIEEYAKNISIEFLKWNWRHCDNPSFMNMIGGQTDLLTKEQEDTLINKRFEQFISSNTTTHE